MSELIYVWDMVPGTNKVNSSSEIYVSFDFGLDYPSFLLPYKKTKVTFNCGNCSFENKKQKIIPKISFKSGIPAAYAICKECKVPNIFYVERQGTIRVFSNQDVRTFYRSPKLSWDPLVKDTLTGNYRAPVIRWNFDDVNLDLIDSIYCD